MIEDIKALGTNIKSLMDKQTEVEELSRENAQDIRDMKAQGGRIKSSAPADIQTEIYQALVENTDNFKKLANKDIKQFDFRVKAVGDMSFAVNGSSIINSVGYVRPGIIEAANRPLHIRDLIPKGTMTGSNFVFLREGVSEGGITAVSEGSTKSQIDFDVTELTVPAEFLAGWLRISTKMLDDIPSMRMFLSNRLMEALLTVEDAQLLNGSGVAPNLDGINTTGNFTAASGSATIDIEQLVEAIAQLAALGRQPDGIILNPSDYYSLILNKASTSGEYDLPPIVVVQPSGLVTIAGVPVVWTVAQTAGTFTVGDFRNGSAMLLRETPRIEFFNQDGTNVRENKITIRIEERLAFAVFAATYFVKGTFS